jgi:hypothetical protein
MTDPNTGGQKGAKLERYDLIPIRPFRLVADAYKSVGDDPFPSVILRNTSKFWFSGEGQYCLSSSAAVAMRLIERELGPSTGTILGIPSNSVEEVARTYGYGAIKYTDRNWEKGYAWGLSWAALTRHAKAHMDGIVRDESGLMHLAHVVWHCFALLEWSETHPELDNRLPMEHK